MVAGFAALPDEDLFDMALDEEWRSSPIAMAHELGGADKPPHLEVLSNAIVDAMTGNGPKRIIVTMPPRHGKSTIVSQWTPLWALDSWPEKRVILTSYEASFAAHWGRTVRDLAWEHTGRLRLRLNPAAGAARGWYTTEGGYMVTAGVGGAITGRGADLLIIDDPIKNRDEAESKRQRDNVWGWWQTTARTRLEPGGVIVIVMTRWHEDDLVGRLLEQDRNGEGENWNVISFPAIATSKQDELVKAGKRKIGDPLWPERYTVEMFKGIKVDEYYWLAMYQQEPTSPKGRIIKREWYAGGRNRYDPLDIAIRSNVVARWISLDTAMKDEGETAFSVAVVGELLSDYKLTIRHVWRERVNFPDLVSNTARLIRDFNRDGKLHAVIVEDAASGTSLVQTLSAMLRDEVVGDPAHIYEPVAIVPVQPFGSKPLRLRKASVWMRDTMVLLPDPAANVPWLFDFEEELYAAPTGTYWDQVDATSQLIVYLEDVLSEGWVALGQPTTVLPAEENERAAA